VNNDGYLTGMIMSYLWKWSVWRLFWLILVCSTGNI